MSEIRKILTSFIWPVFFAIALVLVKITEVIFQLELHRYGILPRNVSGLRGILFSPFIHGDYNHLASNILPLIVLGWALNYFYRKLSIQIIVFSWLMSGLWVWVFAREAYHIGASSLIYAWAAFLFVSGILRSHPRLMALSLLVAFLYGSMVWGIFPFKERVSWEGHLMGMMAGIVLAWFFREKGPQKKKYSWEIEEEPDEPIDPDDPPYWMTTSTNPGPDLSYDVKNRKVSESKGKENEK